MKVQVTFFIPRDYFQMERMYDLLNKQYAWEQAGWIPWYVRPKLAAFLADHQQPLSERNTTVSKAYAEADEIMHLMEEYWRSEANFTQLTLDGVVFPEMDVGLSSMSSKKTVNEFFYMFFRYYTTLRVTAPDQGKIMVKHPTVVNNFDAKVLNADTGAL
jgi:hypothetical protein